MKLATREEGYGCLFGLVGSVVGVFLGMRSFQAYADELRAADPNAFVCGNPGIAALFGGLILGGLIGVVTGMVLSHLMPPSSPDA
jgi:hypothetical protein